MRGKRIRRRTPGLTVNNVGHRKQLWHYLGVALYRWRWQLTPAYVALGVLLTSWFATLVLHTAGTSWTIAAYAVGAVCTVAWIWFGLRRTYDRVFGAIVVALGMAWTLAVATAPGIRFFFDLLWWPGSGLLYGLWALGWPVLGIGWWAGPAFRSGVLTSAMRKRWDSVSELAGLAGAKLAGIRQTPVGRVMTVLLPGDKTHRDVNRERIEHAYGARVGSVAMVRDKANARRIELHVIERDPWADGTEIPNPLTTALPLLEGAVNVDNLPEVA